MNNPIPQFDRRQLLQWGGFGLGTMALSSLLGNEMAQAAAPTSTSSAEFGGLDGLPHFPAKAKRIIFLTQSGSPSQIELFDPKPGLHKQTGIELPDSVRMGQEVSTMTRSKKQIVMPSIAKFKKYGKSVYRSGGWSRPSSAMFQHVDGGWRREGRSCAWQDRRFLIQRGRGQGAHP